MQCVHPLKHAAFLLNFSLKGLTNSYIDDSTAFVHMDAMKKLDKYYITLKNILTENNLLDKPGQVYNVDEFGMPLDHGSRVLASKAFWTMTRW